MCTDRRTDRDYLISTNVLYVHLGGDKNRGYLVHLAAQFSYIFEEIGMHMCQCVSIVFSVHVELCYSLRLLDEHRSKS